MTITDLPVEIDAEAPAKPDSAYAEIVAGQLTGARNRVAYLRYLSLLESIEVPGAARGGNHATPNLLTTAFAQVPAKDRPHGGAPLARDLASAEAHVELLVAETDRCKAEAEAYAAYATEAGIEDTVTDPQTLGVLIALNQTEIRALEATVEALTERLAAAEVVEAEIIDEMADEADVVGEAA